jgi:hypothetical protein
VEPNKDSITSSIPASSIKFKPWSLQTSNMTSSTQPTQNTLMSPKFVYLLHIAKSPNVTRMTICGINFHTCNTLFYKPLCYTWNWETWDTTYCWERTLMAANTLILSPASSIFDLRHPKIPVTYGNKDYALKSTWNMQRSTQEEKGNGALEMQVPDQELLLQFDTALCLHSLWLWGLHMHFSANLPHIRTKHKFKEH